MAGVKVDGVDEYMRQTLWANDVIMCKINDTKCSSKSDQINLLNYVRKYFQ